MAVLRPETTLIRAVERYLPKHLMAYCADIAIHKGFEFREDINDALVLGAASDIIGYDLKMQDAVSTTLDSFMPGMLRTLPDSPSKALLASSLFLVTLVDRQLYQDVKSSAVLTALLIVDEASKDQEFWGASPQAVQTNANNLITFCNLKGLYLTTTVH